MAVTDAIANVVVALLVTLSAVNGVLPINPLKTTAPLSPAILSVLAPLIVVVASLKFTPPPPEVVNVTDEPAGVKATGPVKVIPPELTVISPATLIAVPAVAFNEVNAYAPPTFPEKVSVPVAPALIVKLRVLDARSASMVLAQSTAALLVVNTIGVPVSCTAPCKLIPAPAARVVVMLSPKEIAPV